MRLILPTGPDGADREYVLDDVMVPDRLTLFEVGELVRLSGQDLSGLFSGLGELSDYLGEKGVTLPVAMSRHPKLMRYFQAVCWLVRYRAGERTPSGSVLTFEQATAFPLSGMRFEADPGDEIGDGEDEAPPDPPKRSPAGGRAGGRGKAPAAGSTRRTRSSGRKS